MLLIQLLIAHIQRNCRYYSVEDMLEGSESEVEDMVKSYHDSATELAKFLVVLKQLVLLVTK